MLADAALGAGRGLEQEGGVAAGELGQGGRDLDRGDVVLALEVLDHALERVEAAGGEGVLNLLLEAADPDVVDGLDGRQVHALDRLAGGVLDRAEELVARGARVPRALRAGREDLPGEVAEQHRALKRRP